MTANHLTANHLTANHYIIKALDANIQKAVNYAVKPTRELRLAPYRDVAEVCDPIRQSINVEIERFYNANKNS